MRWTRWLLNNRKIVHTVVTLSVLMQADFLDLLKLCGWKWG
jgi:hypothetical protein